MLGLVYVGDGSQLMNVGKHHLNVPTRNLSPEEVKKYGGKRFLIKSGLYAEPFQKPVKTAIKAQAESEESAKEN